MTESVRCRVCLDSALYDCCSKVLRDPCECYFEVKQQAQVICLVLHYLKEQFEHATTTMNTDVDTVSTYMEAEVHPVRSPH